MTNENLYHLLETRFPTGTQALALTSPERRYSYQDMQVIVNRYCQYIATIGLRPGDRLAVQTDKSPEAVFLYLACLKAAVIYIPLNIAYTATEMAYFIENARPSCLVCSPDNQTALTPIAEKLGVKTIETMDAQGQGSWATQASKMTEACDTQPVHGDDIAVILYTSGTTGRSKGAMLSHENLKHNAQTLHTLWGWKPGDVLLHALPINHAHGLFVALHCSLLNGSNMLFLPRFDPTTVIKLLPEATVMMGVPTFYTRLLAQDGFNKAVCRNMRLFISGSAPLLESTFEAFEERTGHRILERYGMTEAGMITSNPLEGERVAGSVGFPLPGTEVRVVNDSGVALPDGEKGMLQIRGKHVFKGYWQMPEKIREEFTEDGFFMTGDIATCIDSRITIVGRGKDLIISGGYNVYPKEVEQVIDAIENVLESAVIGLPDPDFGESTTAIVVPSDPSAPPTDTVIIQATKAALANYKVPKQVFFLDALPRNSMGKVQKNKLREQFTSGHS